MRLPDRHLVLHYDAELRRVWIGGQRCHHGATGAVLAGLAAVGLITSRAGAAPLVALAATGSVLMAHDWHDRTVWFARDRRH